MRTNNIKAKGFTLVELSIVLVIIGLIVGGVLAGQDLIKAAQLRAVLSDIEKYNTAVHTFQLKYDALPGDMPNATDIWGANEGNTLPPTTAPGALCGYTEPPGKNTTTTAISTCNGTGDGIITNWVNNGTDSVYAGNESIYFWRHLQNAGLINCNCSGQSYANYASPYIGFNSPLSSLGNGSGYDIVYYDASPSTYFNAWAMVYPMSTGHYFTFGMGGWSLSPVLTATEAYNLDSKIDDGIPSTGGVQSLIKGNPGASPNCATNRDASLAKYDFATSGLICSLLFKASF